MLHFEQITQSHRDGVHIGNMAHYDGETLRWREQGNQFWFCRKFDPHTRDLMASPIPRQLECHRTYNRFRLDISPSHSDT